MNHLDVAANLALKLTTETGSCHGSLALYDVKPGEQLRLFGCVLTPWGRNTITLNGLGETVTSLDRHLVFGRQVRKAPVLTRWAELGGE